MDLEDRISIVTPEGVPVEMVVAGIGSRFIAGLLDVTLEMIGFLVVFLTLRSLGLTSGLGLAMLFVAFFVVFFGFHVLFEVFNRGRTPGKTAAGLRVVCLDGSPIKVGPSLIRNLLRIVDGWMILTVVLAPIGFITAFATLHSQRLGDLAAGSVVVRERFRPSERTLATRVTTPTPTSLDWDVNGLTNDEVLVIQRYLERRAALPMHAQLHLAEQLAHRFRPRVPGADPRLGDEQFLEWVLARRQGRA